MAHLMTRVTSLLILSAALCFSSMVVAGEKKEMTYVKTNSRVITKSSSMLADAPNHEVKQETQVSDIKYSDPSFRITSEVVYMHADELNGSGPHRGHFIDTHEDGSNTYGTFEGMTKTVVNADGSWSANWQGNYKYIGGSGKYKGIKGSGTYKGRASSTEAGIEEGKETIEY
jgi:hypothetical protein